MAPREDLISSAVTFLQDPSVASSPIEKRIEFLKSKNLTQEEVDISLARANDQLPQQSQNTYPVQPYRAPPQNYNYPFNPYGEWRPPPPEPPKRDWRDWFIMATVVGGAGYGLWVMAERYIKPLIAPPTPPQLEQDKAAIDEQFNKAFALLDTLSSDTAALKEAEETRTQRLDSAISDVEAIVAELRTANQKREDDARRMETDIKSLKESLPKAIDSVEKSSEKQLKELSVELGSLKLLMSNRMGASSSNPYPTSATPTTSNRNVVDGISSVRSGSSTPATEAASGSSSNITGVNAPSTQAPFSTTQSYGYSAPSSSSTVARPKSATPFGAAGGKAAIPAWQMAAQNKAKEMPASSPHQETPVDGADAVATLAAS